MLCKTKIEKTEKEKTDDMKCYMSRSVKDFNWFRNFWQILVTKIVYGISYHLIYRLEVHGKENIPKTNNYLVVGNHLSTLDPPLLCNFMPHRVSFMAKKELFYHPVLKVMLDWLGTFAVDRENVGLSTIKSARAVRDTKNWVLGIFPQGTREKPGEIHKATRGFVRLAKATNCDILPIGIVGTENRRNIPFTGKIVVKIGPVIKLSDNPDEMFDKWIKSIQELTGFKYVPDVSEELEKSVEK